MLTFTSIPRPYASLSEPVRYAVRQDDDTPGDLLVRIASAEGTLLGAKRFVAVTDAEFDIAPILRHTVRFIPTGGGTGFRPATDRMATVLVAARQTVETTATDTAADTAADTATDAPASAPTDTAADPAAEARAPVRSLLPGRTSVTGPVLLTTMPRMRPIAPDACDELTLWSDSPLTVTVTARRGDTATVQSQTSASGGLHLFRLDMRDFPGAEELCVDAGACGTVRYRTLPPPEGSLRLAWRTTAGSMEHYTFPSIRSLTVEGGKERILSPEGRTAFAGREERRLRLESAFERPETLEALAELLSSVQVWRVEGDRYTPVDATTEQALIARNGMPGRLSIEIRSTRNASEPWN